MLCSCRILLWLPDVAAIMPGYLTHSEPRFFLFFLECGAQGDVQLMDLLGVCFSSDLPAQISDAAWFTPDIFGIVPLQVPIVLRRENNECPSGRFPTASALVAVNCGLAVLAFNVRQSRPRERNKQILNNFQMSNILKPKGFIVKATSSRKVFLDAWYAW